MTYTIADRINDDADSNNEMDFKGIDLYRDYGSGAVQYSSVLTSAVMAWGADSDIPGDDTVLTIGSTGFIQFIVEGQDEAGLLRLSSEDKLQLTGKHGTHIRGGDSNNTVEISTTSFSYDAATATSIIDAGDHDLYGDVTKKNFEFQAKMSEFTGSVQIQGDLLTNGHILSRSLNVIKADSGENVSTGFGFRVTNNDALELYKYDSFCNYTQRIALFGDGAVFKDDALSNFPIFGTSNYGPNDQITIGNDGSSTTSVWETSGATVYYDSGTVLIGKDSHSETATANSYDLEVFNKSLFESGLEIGLGDGSGIEILSTEIKNVEKVNFNATDALNDNAIHTVFRGTLSSLYLDDLPVDYEYRREANPKLWFLAEPKQINLREFNLGSRLADGSTNLTDDTNANKRQLTVANLFYGEDVESEIVRGRVTNSTITDLFDYSIDGSKTDLINSNIQLTPGMKTVWFDQIQKDVEMRNFKYDSLDSLCNITIENELSVSAVHFTATEDTTTYVPKVGVSNPDFDGTIDTILGTENFNLTNFVDDITTKSNLSVETLSIGTIGDITPEDTDTTNIGSVATPFNASYVNTTHIGEATITTTTLDGDRILTIDTPLQITDPAGIILADGSPLNGMGVEGDLFTTFDYVSLSTYKNVVYRIKGDITQKKERPNTPSTELTKLYIYESTNDSGLIIPNDSTGTYYDNYNSSDLTFQLKNSFILVNQNISTIDVNLTDESGIKRNKLYISTFRPDSINDIIDLNTYIPGTDEFNHKFFTDFNYFQNDHMLAVDDREFSQYLPFGYITGELVVYNKTKYLQTTNQTDDTNKHLIQHISYFDVPVEDEDSVISSTGTREDLSPFASSYDTDSNEANYFYFAPKNTEDRIDGFYHYFIKSTLNEITDTFGGDFLLYPKITFRNWKNDRNDTSFEVVPYDEWDIIDYVTNPSQATVVPSNIDASWKKSLMELTFSYLKYGKPGKLNPVDITVIEAALQDPTIVDSPESYSTISRSFNGVSIVNAVRFSSDIFDFDGNDINIISPA